MTNADPPAIMRGVERRSDRWTRWIGAAALLSAAGCTDGSGASGFDPEGLELLADPPEARAPSVNTIALGLSLNPVALEVGDFDGDGNIDAFVSGIEPGVGVAAAMFLGDGSGGFAAPFDPGFSGCSAYPVVGDITGDGRTDVITRGCANDLNVFEGQPDGTLALWSAWPAIEYGSFSGSAIADFEGDGDGDLVSLRVPDAAFLDLTLGNGGQGVWSVETSEIGDPTWSTFDPVGMSVGHFDGDGLLDVVLLDRDNDVATMQGIPPANFAFPRELGVDIPPWSVRTGDLDDDGLTDLVVSSVEASSVQVLRVSGGTGGFIPLTPVSLEGYTPYDTAVGDIDGDGSLDVAMVSNTAPSAIWLEGDGSGALSLVDRFNLPSPAIRIHIRDLDGDGTGDLIAATYDDDSLTVVLSAGS